MRERIEREHILQRHLCDWVGSAVIPEHLFLAFDRGPATGRYTHARQAARGIRAGTPDTLLMISGFPDIWCELKARGPRPTEEQLGIAEDIQAVGRLWFWTDTVHGYWRKLLGLNVSMRPNAEFLAEYADTAIESEIAKEELRRGKLPKSMTPYIAKGHRK